ncbi:TetR/AcrR family transcriptional regulator [Sandaracinobacter sp. RS1-74]|uniref:TetR family transcriptional regulator n=1 Tax=Sandaracinobacteroides sayramensis TaxID=2913411 RepID=UPI001EDA1DF2|nr:TetR family transcriptional regulator [Sandaracinobacteroides sayramensis]MCG2842092.1 TetR/AcrR family transcriptional regulator [Sandaracinobacteroides sayramensis]
MAELDDLTFTRAARSRIAAEGIRGLSLRTVAQEAGGSVGSLNYRIGDKAALVARLIDEERRERQRFHEGWLARARPLDLKGPQALATVVAAFLDEAATLRRESALAGCELLLEATIDPKGYAGVAGLFDDEAQFWRELLKPGRGAQADVLGLAIAGYCRDELPFTIALPGHAGYRLLRAAILQRLAEGLAGPATGLAAGFEALVAACGDGNAAVPLPLDLVHGSRKAELAGHIAALMAERGLAAISHRAVAARAGVANSSVAHHFRTRDELMYGGLGAQILQTRWELRSAGLKEAQGRHGMELIRATHMIALSAARDPLFQPFALDMRRRRAENVVDAVGKAIGGAGGLDRAAVQAATIAMIGSGLAALARGADGSEPLVRSQDLAGLRAGSAPG